MSDARPQSSSAHGSDETGPARPQQTAVAVDWKPLALVGVFCFLVGLALVRPFAGSWNDGSRLACIESLAERSTWVIDDSLFVFPNGRGQGRGVGGESLDLPNPYDPASEILANRGTLDLMQIQGHFYSDKSPVPSLVLAGAWRIGRIFGLPAPAQDPALFCWVMGAAGAALPLALGAVAIWWISSLLARSTVQTWGLFLGGTLATMAPCYARHINNHILMWADSALVLALLVSLSRASAGRFSWSAWILGNALGIGYTIDSGIGPAQVLAVGVWGWVAWRQTGWRVALLVIVGMVPWIGLHHGLGYAIAGSFGPINANPEFFKWAGSPFTATSLTGGWNHPSVGKFLIYSADMLFGKKGILFHQGLGLLGCLALLALVPLPTDRPRGGERAVLWGARIFFAASFLVYATGSNNQSGLCRSVRWFLPLAVPLWYAACLAWRANENVRRAFPWLVGLGGVLGVVAAWFGPWNGDVLPGYWLLVALQVGIVVAILGAQIRKMRGRTPA